MLYSVCSNIIRYLYVVYTLPIFILSKWYIRHWYVCFLYSTSSLYFVILYSYCAYYIYSPSVRYTWNRASVNFSLVVRCNMGIRLIYLNHPILSSWWVLYLLNFTNVLFLIKICMILLSPYLNFSTRSSDYILQQTKILRCFWMLFVDGKWMAYSCPEGISLG